LQVSEESVAYQALNLARANDGKINAHEELCAERYGNIHKAIDDIKGVLWKAGAARREPGSRPPVAAATQR
jgi:hypothetical protein